MLDRVADSILHNCSTHVEALLFHVEALLPGMSVHCSSAQWLNDIRKLSQDP